MTEEKKKLEVKEVDKYVVGIYPIETKEVIIDNSEKMEDGSPKVLSVNECLVKIMKDIEIIKKSVC